MNAIYLAAIVCPLLAQGAEMKTLDQIHLRDPFVLTVRESGTYYLYGTWHPKDESGFYAYKSKDLQHWEGPFLVFRPEKEYWGQRDFWAPEVYAFKGKYYMFCTFSPKEKGPRGTAVLVSASPEGPFALHSNGAVTPKDWYALDGTLFVDKDEKPWMVFCHEWVQIGDGTICAIRLSEDLSHAVGEPKVLFRASQASWGAESSFGGKPGRVTDVPFLFHTADGGLSMLWSTFCRGKGYAVGTARSASGSIEGPWAVSNEPLFNEDGGHAMLFATFDGKLLMSLHQPNVKRRERPRFVEVLMGKDGLQMLPGCAQTQAPGDSKEAFLRMCDQACAELNKESAPFEEKYRNEPDPKTHHVPFFEDAYAVRALCVAYDMTGKKEYLDTCRHWADRVVDAQDRMIPKGAYYLNYFRQPGKEDGEWFVADSGSVGAGVLAVAVRAGGNEKKRYLDSAQAFAHLVMSNYVGPNGGITDGIWSGFADEWWCSTATFGTFVLHLYKETGNAEYLKAGLRALDWLARQDMRKAEHISFAESAPGVVFYCSEFFATALQLLGPKEAACQTALPQIDVGLQWMAENQKGLGATTRWDYLKESTYMSGLPYVMYLIARALPERNGLTASADKELDYIMALLSNPDTPGLTHLTTWELTCWAMLSEAEKLNPGGVLRTSKHTDAAP